MALTTGSHRLGPQNASLQVKTYREGLAAKAGHDLVIEVTRWEATLDVTADLLNAVHLSADARSLEVRKGQHGVRPLTDKDRADIRRTIDDRVLRGEPIGFRSTTVRPVDDAHLTVDGQLTIAGTTRPVTAQLDVSPEGHITATIPVTQSEWGIKPYHGLMGALKVRDEVDVVIDAQL